MSQKPIEFAQAGARRQDSVLNGISLLKGNPLVCIHDSARPLIQLDLIRSVVEAAAEWGAGVAALPVKGTIKRVNNSNFIIETIPRADLWEMQTPQVIRLDWLLEGFQLSQKESFTVTDDVSLIELIGKSVKIVQGNGSNLKITTPEDLSIAEYLVQNYALL